MGYMFFWVKFSNTFVYFVVSFLLVRWRFIQYKYPNRVHFDCKTKLCLIVPGRQGRYVFTQENFYLQGTLGNINEQDIFS